ncbi:DUF4328 domain-containing protein [Streptomyces sp. NPDC003691]
MTLCSICRRDTAAGAQGLCARCAAGATIAGQQPAAGTVPGIPAAPAPAAGAQAAGHPAVPPPPAAPAPGPVPAPAAYPAPAPYGAAPQYGAVPQYGTFTPPPRPVKAPVGLSYAVIALLGLCIVVDLFAIGVSVHVRGVAESLDNSPFSITQAEADDADRMMAVAIAFKGVALLVTGVLFVIWFAAARANAAVFAPDVTRWGQGWAIGGWFIPLAGLVIPRLVAGTIWEGSRRERYAHSGTAPLTVWWTLYVIGMLAGQVGLQNYSRSETPFEALFGATWLIIADTIDIAAAVAAIVVVRKITRMQQEKAAAAWQPAPVPPVHHTY